MSLLHSSLYGPPWLSQRVIVGLPGGTSHRRAWSRARATRTWSTMCPNCAGSAATLTPVFDASLSRFPGALLKSLWPLSARTCATSLPFASMFPCCQGRERFSPSIRIPWRGSKIARACALNDLRDVADCLLTPAPVSEVLRERARQHVPLPRREKHRGQITRKPPKGPLRRLSGPSLARDLGGAS